MEVTEQQKKQKDLQESSGKSIVDLNDDCLEEIFSYFQLVELMEVDKVCPRFRDVADEYFYKKEKFLVIDERHDEEQIANLVKRMGPYVSTLEIGTPFPNSPITNLELLLIHFIKLEHVTIRWINVGIHRKCLKNMFKSLKSVKLTYCELTDELCEDLLETASKLESLCLQGNEEITGSFLPDLKDQLKRIDLRYYGEIVNGPYFGEFCKNNHKLESLLFGCGFNFRDSVWEDLNELKNLRSLRIQDVWNVEVPPKVLVLPKLTRLEIDGIDYNIWNDFLIRLGGSLVHLILGILNSPTLKFVDFLPKLTKLRVFKITHEELKDSDLLSMNMESRKTLEHLEISSSNEITDEGLLKLLKDFPNIKKLVVTGCRKITDALIIGLVPILKERPHILEIYACGTKISESIKEDQRLDGNLKIKLNIS